MFEVTKRGRLAVAASALLWLLPAQRLAGLEGDPQSLATAALLSVVLPCSLMGKTASTNKGIYWITWEKFSFSAIAGNLPPHSRLPELVPRSGCTSQTLSAFDKGANAKCSEGCRQKIRLPRNAQRCTAPLSKNEM